LKKLSRTLPGGKLEKYYPLYEAAATIFYTPGW
jgi:Na+-transporting NADH:ubiquinone oxidoreductase subunit NqrB